MNKNIMMVLISVCLLGSASLIWSYGINIEMVKIPDGTFQMGSNSNDNEKPVHTVTISSFYMGKYEVTQGQWNAVMGSNPSGSPKGDNYPVEKVSWNDCQEFIRRLNKKTGKQYRLPTEAEWEYACRAMTTEELNGDLDTVAWYSGNSGSMTHQVGQKQANAFGLYDMLGNVQEWCQDWYGSYEGSSQVNPTGPALGSDHVGRGGFWCLDPRGVRAALRDRYLPGVRLGHLGFRLALGSAGG